MNQITLSKLFLAIYNFQIKTDCYFIDIDIKKTYGVTLMKSKTGQA